MKHDHDERLAWERCRGESSRAYHAFAHYRDLASHERSLDRAWKDHRQRCCGDQPGPEQASKRRPTSMARQSVDWGWVDRAEAKDRHDDAEKRRVLAAQGVAAAKKHAQICAAQLAASVIPARVLIDSLQSPTVLASLVARVASGASGAIEVLGVLARLAASIPQLISAERLSLGMSTAAVEVTDKPQTTIGNRIASNPRATDLALALLDELAKPDAPYNEYSKEPEPETEPEPSIQ